MGCPRIQYKKLIVQVQEHVKLPDYKKRLKLALKALRYGTQPGTAQVQITPLTNEEINEAREFFPMDKFFIYGHARSGTTLLTRLIRLHPDVHCNYQAHFFTRPPLLESLVASPAVKEWLSRKSNRWNRGKDLSPVVMRAASDFIMEREARKENARIVGDKSPNSILNGKAVELTHKIYPDAYLIFIVRDGRDTAISHRIQSFIDFPEHLSKDDLKIRIDFQQNPEPYIHGKRSLFTEKSIRRAAQSWVKNVLETDQQGKTRYGNRYISLRYEDLLANPAQEMKRLWAFLEVDSELPNLESAINAEMQINRDSQWQQEKDERIAKSVQKGRSGSWQEMFTQRDSEIFQSIAREQLETWGYPIVDKANKQENAAK